MAQLGHTDPKMTLGLYARALTSKSRRADRALSGAGGDESAAEQVFGKGPGVTGVNPTICRHFFEWSQPTSNR